MTMTSYKVLYDYFPSRGTDNKFIKFQKKRMEWTSRLTYLSLYFFIQQIFMECLPCVLGTLLTSTAE